MVYKETVFSPSRVYTIPAVECCPKLRAAYEALRHHTTPPDFSDWSDSEVEADAPAAPLAQPELTAPTDAELGLPPAREVALSAIPAPLLALSRALASPARACAITGYSRAQRAQALAHAANLLRADDRARAILLVVSSEKAVREALIALCQALDEVQVISFSRSKAKRQATLLRLRQAQYPGIVVVSEGLMREAGAELRGALRANRLAKNWEIVASDAVTNSNMQGQYSPLSMLRDGMAEKVVVFAGKSLSKANACWYAGECGVHVDNRFWLTSADVKKMDAEDIEEMKAVLGREKPNEYGDVMEDDSNKENNAAADYPAEKTTRRAPKGPKKRASSQDGGKRRASVERKASKGKARKSSKANEDSMPLVDKTPPSSKRKKSRRVSAEKNLVTRRTLKPAAEDIVITKKILKPAAEEIVVTKTTPKTPKIGKKSRRVRAEENLVTRKTLKPAAEEIVITKTTPKAPKIGKKKPRLSDGVVKLRNRRKSPRISPPLPSTEVETPPAQVKSRSRKRRSSRSKTPPEPAKTPTPPPEDVEFRSLDLSRSSGSDDDHDWAPESEDALTVAPNRSRRSRNCRVWKERQLQLPSRGDNTSDEEEEKFYSPLSQLATPPSPDTTPDKFVSPLSSTPPRRSSKKLRESLTPRKLSGESYHSARASLSPQKAQKLGSHIKKKNRRIDVKGGTETSAPSTKRKTREPRASKRRSSGTGPLPSNFSPSSLEGGAASDIGKSVFDGFLHSRRLRRALSFPGVVAVPRETSSQPQRFTLLLGNGAGAASQEQSMARQLDNAAHIAPTANSPRRVSLPASYLTLPMKPSSPEPARRGATVSGSGHKIATIGFEPGVRSRRPPPLADTIHRKSRGVGMPSRKRTLVDGANRPEPNGIDVRSRGRSPLADPNHIRSDRTNTPRERSSRSRRSRSKSRDLSLVGALGIADGANCPEPNGVEVRSRGRSPLVDPSRIRSSGTNTSRERSSRHSRSHSKTRDLPEISPPRSEAEVIVISSETEDEISPKPRRVRRKQRRLEGDEARTPPSWNPRKERSRSRAREGIVEGTATPTHRDEASTPAEQQQVSPGPQDLAAFMRGVQRNNSINGLSRAQKEAYNRYLTKGQRAEKQGRRKEALDAYQKCFDIYDGDQHLISQFMGLSSYEGALRASDIPRQKAKSSIKKRSRRRRNSGTRRQVGGSSTAVDVIDLTSL